MNKPTAVLYDGPMSILYPYPKYAKKINTLDDRLEKIERLEHKNYSQENSIRHLIVDIAAYSNIIEIYKGNSKIMDIWIAFPDGVYFTHGNTIDNATVQKTEMDLYNLAYSSNISNDMLFDLPKEKNPVYLVANPSRTITQNNDSLQYFGIQIGATIDYEDDQQGLVTWAYNLLFRKPFLWTMEKRIEYFKDFNKNILKRDRFYNFVSD